MEGLRSLTSSVLTAVKSRTILVVHVSVLGVGWAILQHVYLIRFHICFKFVTTEILLIYFTDYILFVVIKHVWLYLNVCILLESHNNQEFQQQQM